MLDDNFFLDIVTGDNDGKISVSPRKLQMTLKRKYMSDLREDVLSKLMPDIPEINTSYHIVTGGVFNMWNWIPLLAKRLGSIDELYISTWMINEQATQELAELIDSGLVETSKVVTGLYFRQRAASCWIKLKDKLNTNQHRIIAADNHSKVILIKNAKQNVYLSIEGSSNLTQNTRIEQNVITNNLELYNFHKEWLDSLFPKTSIT